MKLTTAILTAAAVSSTLLSAAPASAVVTFFNDQAAFNAATAGFTFTFDGFDNDIAQADVITLDSGVISTNRDRLVDDNSVSNGVYNNAIDGDGGTASEISEWLFPQEVTAVGFDFFDVRAGRLTLEVDGVTSQVSPVDGDGFFGFLSSTAVTEVTFGNATNLINEFDLDNLQFGSADVAAVPLPATLPLLLAGFAAMGIARRKRG